MDKNKFNLRNVVAVVICLVGLMAFVGCESKVNYEYEDSIENCENKGNSVEGNDIVGRWADANFLGIRSIVFTEDLRVEGYFYFFYPHTLDFVAYSISGNNITFTAHLSRPTEIISETFEFVLNGNYLTIKLFSSPFSDDTGGRYDVHFTRIE